MHEFKKLLFLPFTLASFYGLLFFANYFIASPQTILNFDKLILFRTVYLVLLLVTTALFFVLLATFADKLQLALPAILLTSLVPFLIYKPEPALLMTIGSLVIMLIIYTAMQKRLKSYITFDPIALFLPSIKFFMTLLLLSICVLYYLSLNTQINSHGFSLPDNLIQFVIKTAQVQENVAAPQVQTQPALAIPKDQLDTLKANPQLLAQYGVTPQELDMLTQPQPKQSNTEQQLLADSVKNQLQQIINPYTRFIPIAFAVLFFLSIKWLSSIISYLLYPILPGIFYTLEKLKFFHYEKETREVKKMVV